MVIKAVAEVYTGNQHQQKKDKSQYVPFDWFLRKAAAGSGKAPFIQIPLRKINGFN